MKSTLPPPQLVASTFRYHPCEFGERNINITVIGVFMDMANLAMARPANNSLVTNIYH